MFNGFQSLVLILIIFHKSVVESVELLCSNNDIANTTVFFMEEESLVSIRSLI